MVKLSSTESVTVTFCGSGHCPGSVMIFIEGCRGNVLFTGDFRLPLNCAGRLYFLREHHLACSGSGNGSNWASVFDLLTNSNASSKAVKAASATTKKPLNQESQKIKSVQDLYVDMTFFKTEVTHIPSREDSVDALITFIRSHLGLGENFYHKPTKDEPVCFKNCVYLKTSARIGYEYVYKEIHNRLGFKIHVNQLIYKIYDKLAEIQKVLTLNPYETPIHSCIYENRKRDLAKTDLMSSSQGTSRASAKPCAYSGSESYGETIKYPNEFNLDLPCEPFCNASNGKRGVKINAAKVILSAMWFTDTAGVDRIFLEYKPHKSEMDSIAYKPYTKIYRLCFSFHSSFEELVNFINIIKPRKRIYSIALPESTTEQQINDCFYDATGQFVPFQLTRLTRQSSLDSNRISKLQASTPASSQSSLSSSQLVLRKRSSVSDIVSNKKNDDPDSSYSSNELDANESDDE